MTLSDLTVRQAKAAEKTYSIPDTDGLGLVVARTGGKSWHLRYYWLGKQKRISLGNYPEIAKRAPCATKPGASGKGRQPPYRSETEATRGQACGRLHLQGRLRCVGRASPQGNQEGRNSTLSQILRIFNKDVLPSLKQMSIYDIRRPQLLGVLARIEERKAFTTAEKVRTWLGQLFRYALVIVEGLEANPASDLDVVAEPKPPVNHNPYLHLPELPEFLHKLRLYNPRGWQTQLGIRLLFLTGVRTGELRLATPDQFDLDRGLWIIPPQIVKQLQDEMRKAGKRPQDVPPYIVPLSVQAIEIVRYLLRDEAGPGPSAHAPQRTQEAHQREHPQRGLETNGLRGSTDRSRHPRNHLDGAQRDRLSQDLGGRAAFALGPEQGEFGLQPRQVC